jgi:hypothetical protein
MSDDDGLMIIGAKKKKEIKNDDKHDMDTCISYFKKLILTEESLNKERLIEIGLIGDMDKNYIRPTIWKTFLNILPFNSKLDEWVELTIKQRNIYKIKLKSLNALKKFSGDPLGGSNDVNFFFKYISLDGIHFLKKMS